MTSNNVSDAAVIPDLLEQLLEGEELVFLACDGAYNTQQVYMEQSPSALVVIPLCKNARIRKGAISLHIAMRNYSCRRLGRSIWKHWIGYHR